MLSLDDNLERVAMFAIDLAGMATRFDFAVIRWGLDSNWACCVRKDDYETHLNWLCVDIELTKPELADMFVTECVMAGLYCLKGDSFIHVQPTPITEGA